MKILPFADNSQCRGQSVSFESVRAKDAEVIKDLAKLGDFYSLKDLIGKRKSKFNPHPLGTYLKKNEIAQIQENTLFADVFLTKSEIQESRFYKRNMSAFIMDKINSAVTISREKLKKVLPDIEKVKDDSFKFNKAREDARKKLGIEKLFDFNPSLYPMGRFKKAS